MLSRMPIAIALFFTATAAQAQWGTPVTNGRPSTSMAAMSGHLFTVSVPYDFKQLQSPVDVATIHCAVTVLLGGNRVERSKAFQVTIQNGQASGTAVFTWDKSDFDPLTEFPAQIPVECWFDLHIQGNSGNVSYRSGNVGSQLGQNPVGMGASSPEPAAHPAPNTPFTGDVKGTLQ